jgi:hypothetical protein
MKRLPYDARWYSLPADVRPVWLEFGSERDPHTSRIGKGHPLRNIPLTSTRRIP